MQSACFFSLKLKGFFRSYASVPGETFEQSIWLGRFVRSEVAACDAFATAHIDSIKIRRRNSRDITHQSVKNFRRPCSGGEGRECKDVFVPPRFSSLITVTCDQIGNNFVSLKASSSCLSLNIFGEALNIVRRNAVTASG